MPVTHSLATTIDDALAGTFPASDPPAWTPGMARPAPGATVPGRRNGFVPRVVDGARSEGGDTAGAKGANRQDASGSTSPASSRDAAGHAIAANGIEVIDLSRHDGSGRSFVQALGSLAGAVGLVLLIPAAIAAVGAVVAAGVWGWAAAVEALGACIR